MQDVEQNGRYDVFISYAQENGEYATQLYRALEQRGVKAWFAPVCIPPGGDFSRSIGDSLDGGEGAQADNLAASDALVFLLSRHSMASVWCGKELTFAISRGLPVQVLRVDRAELTPRFAYLLSDIQYIEAPALTEEAADQLTGQLARDLGRTFGGSRVQQQPRVSARSLDIRTIARADPWYEEGQTLRCSLSPQEFYLCPPTGAAEGREEWAAQHFAAADHVLDTTLEEVARECGIPDLPQRVEAARAAVFQDFLYQHNGCYFNNKKYGVSRLNAFARSEDFSEIPVLEMELFTTDYFTHRVMKQVCKELFAQRHPFVMGGLDFGYVRPMRIFLTSLGINLLLLDADRRLEQKTLLTVRSKNSAETYGREQYSASVVEGVSLTDYDPFRRTVSLSSAVQRGLWEELGVGPELLEADSIRFYSLFVNLRNLEIGVTCSAQLKKQYDLTGSVLPKSGKDEMLEVAEKRVVPVAELPEFVSRRQEDFLAQAVHAIDSFLRSRGVKLIEEDGQRAYRDQCFVRGKEEDQALCEDGVYTGEHYMAVLDGVTAKGQKTIEGMTTGAFAVKKLLEELDRLEPELTAAQAVEQLNAALARCYDVPFEEVEPCERLQANIALYSCRRKEVWLFGDCQAMVNERRLENPKKVDRVLAEARALVLELDALEGRAAPDGEDPGRQFILPLLRRQALLANRPGEFGYDVLDGGPIQAQRVKVFPVRRGDHVVLASDGYPRLFSSLKESEEYLRRVLEKDPLCIGENRQTKGLAPGAASFDDRAYLSFFA